jgi:hypothetical protein
MIQNYHVVVEYQEELRYEGNLYYGFEHRELEFHVEQQLIERDTI